MLQIVKKKSYILAVLVVFMSMTCCMAAEETAPSVKKLIATRAEVSPVIDGKLDDACWAVAAKADGFSVYQIPKRLHPEQTIGRVCFDDDNIYISMECSVNEMDKFKARIAIADGKFLYSHGGAIEIFVDTNHDKETFQQYLLHPNGSSMVTLPKDDLFRILNEDYLNCKATITEKGFNVEMAFPLAMLHLHPDTAKVWGFNLNRAHDLYEERFDRNGFFSSWSSTKGTPFASPKLFGELAMDTDLSRFYWQADFVSEPQPGDSKIKLRIKNETGRKFSGKLKLAIEPAAGKSSNYEKKITLASGKDKVISFKHFVSAEDTEAKFNVSIISKKGKLCYLGGTQKLDTTPGDTWAAPKPDKKQRKAGFIAFRRPFSQPVLYKAVPKSDEIVSELSISACRGEFEPANFAVYPLRALNGLKVSVSDLAGPDGAVIPASAVDVRKVMWQSDWENPRKFEAREHLLRKFEELSLATGRTQRLCLNVKIPAKAAAGQYKGTISLKSAGVTTKLALNVRVLPFELSAPDEMAYFMYYVGVNKAPFNTAEFFKKIVDDMRDHGMTSFTNYGWFKVKNPDTGKFMMDVDNKVAKKFGVTYAEMMAILRDRGIGTNVPILDVSSMNYDPDSIVALHKICRSRDNWPDVLFYINDEIEFPERIAAARKVLERIKKLAPDIKTTTAIGEKGAAALGHLYDVWIGGTSDEMINKCLSMGNAPWTYSCRETVDVSPAFERAFYGKFAWQRGLKGVGLWSYVDDHVFVDRFARSYSYGECTFGPEWKLTYGHVHFEDNQIIPAATWEGVREGIDDYRYMLTLKKHADKALADDNPKAHKAAQAGLKLLKDISDPVPYLSEDKKYGRDWQAMGDMEGDRARIVDMILAIRKVAKK